MDIDTGDTVRHRPTGEEWLVAGVQGGKVMPCGYPLTFEPVADCDLVEKATPEERLQLLRELAAIRGRDARKDFATRVLGHN